MKDEDWKLELNDQSTGCVFFLSSCVTGNVVSMLEEILLGSVAEDTDFWSWLSNNCVTTFII